MPWLLLAGDVEGDVEDNDDSGEVFKPTRYQTSTNRNPTIGSG